MPEYIIVSFLKPQQGVFKRSEWPLHLTVVPIFWTRKSPRAIGERIATALMERAPILLHGNTREKMGFNHDLPVTELECTERIYSLHIDLLEALGSAIRIKSRRHIQSGYRPHVTDQKEGRIEPGDRVIVDSLSLIELKGEQGRILQTFKFGEQF